MRTIFIMGPHLSYNIYIKETDYDEDDENHLHNGDNSRNLREDDDDLNDPVNVSIFALMALVRAIFWQ